MLEQVLTHLHNWFQVDIRHSKYTIKNGTLDLPFLKNGQYFRIMGSVFSDGLHRYGPDMEQDRRIATYSFEIFDLI